MTVRQSASRLRDLQRVASGVSIVLNELLTRSPAARRLKGDVVGSTTAALHFVQNTVTDVTGLTQGHLRAHPSRVATRSASPLSNAQAESGFVIDESTHTSSLKSKPKSGPNFESESGFSNTDERCRAGSVRGGTDASHSQSVGTLGEAGTEAITSPGAELLGRDDSSSVAVGERGADGASEASEDQTLEQAVEVLQQGSSEEMHEVRSSTAKKDGEKGPETKPWPVIKKRKSRQRRVPATPLGRVFGFAGLGAGLAWGSFQESARRLWEGQGSSPSVLSPFMTEQNAERLAIALCRMRGAALKVGQMLSIQDESLVPAPVLAALESVRQGADVMPQKQLNKMLDKELGPGWRERFVSFDDEPIAAASIGQVHRAVLRDGREVAMKVQYPGVAASIDSDIDNVRLLLDYTNLIPEGLYLDQAMRVAKEELRRECNYEHEAMNQKRYIKLMEGEEGFHVPLVIDEHSTKGVLTTELVSGVAIDKVAMMDQHIRDQVGTQLLTLTLRELFVFRFMQTDPNWGNFLYDESTKTINLIDFGAARDFSKQFVDEYLKMVLACANRDREKIIEKSISLGFLTGKEETAMLDAHTEAAYATGEPFSKSGPFDFHNSNLPRRISELGATMLRHRLTPPPDEAYSLHRKLSGAFLACVKLSATVNCREILLNEYERYTLSQQGEGESAKAASV